MDDFNALSNTLYYIDTLQKNAQLIAAKSERTHKDYLLLFILAVRVIGFIKSDYEKESLYKELFR